MFDGRIHGRRVWEVGIVMLRAYGCSLLIALICLVKRDPVIRENKLR